MHLKKIYENGGATLTKTLRTCKAQKGFMVSLKRYEKKVKSSKEKKVIKAIKKAQKRVLQLRNSYVGVWIDKGIAYIDVSVRVLDKKKAVEFGKENKQLAIYDIKNNDVIALN